MDPVRSSTTQYQCYSAAPSYQSLSASVTPPADANSAQSSRSLFDATTGALGSFGNLWESFQRPLASAGKQLLKGAGSVVDALTGALELGRATQKDISEGRHGELILTATASASTKIALSSTIGGAAYAVGSGVALAAAGATISPIVVAAAGATVAVGTLYVAAPYIEQAGSYVGNAVTSAAQGAANWLSSWF